VLRTVGTIADTKNNWRTGAAARLVIGQARARARIIGLLGFPSNDATLDVDLPAARAVQFTPWVERTTLSCDQRAGSIFPRAVFDRGDAVPIRKRAGVLLEKGQAIYLVV